MKKITLLIISVFLAVQTINAQVVLDTNLITIKWTGTSVPSPYFIQANPRGTGIEWFAIVDNSSTSNITNYAKNIPSGITYFTPPSSTTPIPFDNIVTTLVTNTTNLFYQAVTFNQPIGSWDVSNVTNMSNMFRSATAFNQPIDSWNVGNVTNMDSMFFGASSFDQPIGSWNVGNVTNMSSMFTGVQLSTANYDTLLIGWSTIAPSENPLEPNVSFSGGNSNYCNGDAARTSILNTYSWTITDAGLASNCSDLATEAFDKSSLQLYPNPALSVLNIKVDPNIANQHYTISDALGKIVLKGKLNEGGATISVVQLSKGIYYLKVSGKNAAKFIKE